jgi:NAD/NADP transhydrogenase alpha subunit
MKQGLNQINAFVINSMAGETVPLSVTASSSSVTFALASSIANYDVIIQNAGTKTAFVYFSSGAATATVPGTSGTNKAFPVLAGAIYTMQKNSDSVRADTCSAICAGADTTTLYFTSVQGS